MHTSSSGQGWTSLLAQIQRISYICKYYWNNAHYAGCPTWSYPKQISLSCVGEMGLAASQQKHMSINLICGNTMCSSGNWPGNDKWLRCLCPWEGKFCRSHEKRRMIHKWPLAFRVCGLDNLQRYVSHGGRIRLGCSCKIRIDSTTRATAISPCWNLVDWIKHS